MYTSIILVFRDEQIGPASLDNYIAFVLLC